MSPQFLQGKRKAGSPASVNAGGLTEKSNLGKPLHCATNWKKERLGVAKVLGSSGSGSTTT